MRGRFVAEECFMSKSKVIILIVILLALGVGFWFWSNPPNFFRTNIFNIYNNTASSLPDFYKTEIGNLVSEVSKEVLTPPPLHIGGEKTPALLAKAKIIAETNVQRYNQNSGFLPLFENINLDNAAIAKANDMFKNQYFEHVSPSGVDPGKLVQSFGYDYITTGENLILGNFKSEEELVQAWMDSPGHRANILNARYTEIGVAVIKGNYKGESVWIGVQEFGLPMSACSQPSLSLKNEIKYYENQLENLSFMIDQKRSEIDNMNRHSQNYNNLVDQYNELVKQYQALADEVKVIIGQYNNQVNTFNQCVAGK